MSISNSYKRLPETSPPPEHYAQDTRINILKDLYQKTYFHGTGRHLHTNQDEGGEIVDVLDSVLKNGIQLNPDHLSRIFLETQKTISLTRQRVYARCYAEIFGTDEKGSSQLQYSFGDSEKWNDLYISLLKKIIKQHPREVIPFLRKMPSYILSRFSLKEILKIANVPYHEKQWLSRRATTPGNHPMIFGIDDSNIVEVPLFKGLDAYETRSSQVIPPSDIKSIEVPEILVPIVTKRVQGQIQVIPMELGEALSWQNGIQAALKTHEELQSKT